MKEARNYCITTHQFHVPTIVWTGNKKQRAKKSVQYWRQHVFLLDGRRKHNSVTWLELTLCVQYAMHSSLSMEFTTIIIIVILYGKAGKQSCHICWVNKDVLSSTKTWGNELYKESTTSILICVDIAWECEYCCLSRVKEGTKWSC